MSSKVSKIFTKIFDAFWNIIIFFCPLFRCRVWERCVFCCWSMLLCTRLRQAWSARSQAHVFGSSVSRWLYHRESWSYCTSSQKLHRHGAVRQRHWWPKIYVCDLSWCSCLSWIPNHLPVRAMFTLTVWPMLFLQFITVGLLKCQKQTNKQKKKYIQYIL